MDDIKKIAILMHFEGGGELALDKYSSIDIQRQGKQLNINATNVAGDFAFNSLYDEILELLGENETFNITIQQGGGGAAAFGGIQASYHVNVEREILSFSQKQEIELFAETGK